MIVQRKDETFEVMYLLTLGADGDGTVLSQRCCKQAVEIIRAAKKMALTADEDEFREHRRRLEELLGTR